MRVSLKNSSCDDVEFDRFIGEDFARVVTNKTEEIVRRSEVLLIEKVDFFHVQTFCLQGLQWFYSICPHKDIERMRGHKIMLTVSCLLQRMHNLRQLETDDVPNFTSLMISADTNTLTLYDSKNALCGYLCRNDSFTSMKPFDVFLDDMEDNVNIDTKSFDSCESDAIVVNFQNKKITFPMVWFQLFTTVDVLRTFLVCPSARIALERWLEHFEHCILNKNRCDFDINRQCLCFDDTVLCGLNASINHFMMHTLGDAYFFSTLDLRFSVDPDEMPAKVLKGVAVTWRGVKKITQSCEENKIVTICNEDVDVSDCEFDPLSFLNVQYIYALEIMKHLKLNFIKNLPRLSKSNEIHINYLLKHNSFLVSDDMTSFLSNIEGQEKFEWMFGNILRAYELIRTKSVEGFHILGNSIMVVKNSVVGHFTIPNFYHDPEEVCKSMCVVQSKTYLWQFSNEWTNSTLQQTLNTLNFDLDDKMNEKTEDQPEDVSKKKKKKKKKKNTDTNASIDDEMLSVNIETFASTLSADEMNLEDKKIDDSSKNEEECSKECLQQMVEHTIQIAVAEKIEASFASKILLEDIERIPVIASLLMIYRKISSINSLEKALSSIGFEVNDGALVKTS